MKTPVPTSNGPKHNWPPNPYPGLRPFLISDESDESLIFFGRKEQIHDLLDRLGNTHFMAVLGPSGCGKSSLVKAGLIPALDSGLIYQAGANWVSAEAEPGSAPINNLAKAIADALSSAQRADAGHKVPTAEVLAERMYASTTALVDLAEELPDLLEDNTNLLILVDQFEEIFREDLAQRDEDAQLINLLLNIFNVRPEGLYVVLTMRTDYLEQCATFHGLPEALNQSQYLTPRLNPQQLLDSISGPAELRHYGGKVEPKLARKILSEMTSSSGYDPDLLPLMQHALFWMWRKAQDVERAEGEPVLLTPELYQELAGDGGLQGVLSRRADDIFENALSEEQQRIAECMFRLMSEVDDGARRRRRVTTPDEVAEIADVSPQEARDVIDVFASDTVSFIRWKDDGTTLDVTHESLIRKWEKFDAWALEERSDAEEYRDLERATGKWAEDNRATLTEAGLLRWEEFQKRKGNVKRWAARYGDGFEDVSAYVDLSRVRIQENNKRRENAERLQLENEQAAEREQAAKRRAHGLKVFATIGVALATIAVVGWIYAFDQARTAQEQTERVEAQAVELKAESKKLQVAQAETEDALNKSEQTSQRLEQEKIKLTEAVSEIKRLGASALKVLTLRRAGLVEKEVDAGRPATALRLALDTKEISTDAEKPFHLALARAVTAAPRPGPQFAGRFGTLKSVTWSREIGDWMALWQNGGLHSSKTPESVVLPFKAPPNNHFVSNALSADLSRALVLDSNGSPLIVSSGPLLDPVPLWQWDSESKLFRARFFGDASFLVTLTQKRELVIWDTETGVRSEQMSGVNRFSVSPDGLRLVTASTKKGERQGTFQSTIVVWDLFPKLERRHSYEVEGRVSVLEWGDGEDAILAGFRDGKVASISPNGRRIIKKKEPQKSVVAIAFHKGSGTMAVGLGSSAIELWTLGSEPKQVQRIEQKMHMRGIQFAADGKSFMVRSHADLKVFDTRSGKLKSAIVSDGKPAALSSNGASAITIAKGGASWLWDPASGQRQKSIDKPHPEAVPQVATFSPDGSVVVTGFKSGVVQLSSAQTGKQVWASGGSAGEILSVTITPDNSRLAVLAKQSPKKYIFRLLDASDGTILKEITGLHYLTRNGFSPDGKLLFVQIARGVVDIRGTKTGQLHEYIHVDSGRIFASAFIEKRGSPRLVQLAVAQNNFISVWDIDKGEMVSKTDRYSRPPGSLAVNPLGTKLMAVFSNQMVLWDLENSAGPTPLEEMARASGQRLEYVVFDRHGGGFSVVSRAERRMRFRSRLKRRNVSHWNIVGRTRGRLRRSRNTTSLIKRSEVFDQVSLPKVQFAWPSAHTLQTLGERRTGINVWSLVRKSQNQSMDEEGFAIRLRTPPYWAAFTAQDHLAVHHQGGPSLFAPDEGTSKHWRNRWARTIRSSARTRQLGRRFGLVADVSPDGNFFVVPHGGKPALVYDAKTGEVVAELKAGKSSLRSAVFDPKGEKILTVGSDGIARLWAFDAGARTVRPIRAFKSSEAESKRLMAGRFDATGEYFVTSTSRGQISTWSIDNTKRPVSTTSVGRFPYTIGFTQSGDCVFIANRAGGLLRRKRDSLKDTCAREAESDVVGEASVPGFRLLNYSVEPKGEFAVVSGYGVRQTGTVRSHLVAIYSLRSGKPVAVWVEPSNNPSGWANWSKDGSKLAVPARGNQVRVIKRPQMASWHQLIEYAERAAKPKLSEGDERRLDLVDIGEISDLAK